MLIVHTRYIPEYIIPGHPQDYTGATGIMYEKPERKLVRIVRVCMYHRTDVVPKLAFITSKTAETAHAVALL